MIRRMVFIALFCVTGIFVALKHPREVANEHYSVDIEPIRKDVDVRDSDPGSTRMYRILRDEQEIYSWTGHDDSVFLTYDGVLVYANYLRGLTGCELIGVNLSSGKQLWRTQLTGLGDVQHSEYRNRVKIRMRWNLIEVDGVESAGRYVEYLDPKTGKVIANRVMTRVGGL